MKHIDIRAHFIRGCVNNRLIDIHHIPGIENPSDLLTKPLARVIHEKWVSRLGLNQDVVEEHSAPSNSAQAVYSLCVTIRR
jgi:hypothetical protein